MSDLFYWSFDEADLRAVKVRMERLFLHIFLSSLVIFGTLYVPYVTAEETKLPEDLTAIGLKELLDFDLVVTSPGKKSQTLSKVASAVYVITSEDIRRSGVTHVAEALRLAPGVNVARVSSNQWAVSVRGMNQIFSHMLLVLVDGVSVFSPLTNGVYWETLNLVLEDIDRIEVIRGPGASLWGPMRLTE